MLRRTKYPWAWQNEFEAALKRDAAPLPWDAVLGDDRITIIDFNGNDVMFIVLGADRARAERLARNVLNAVAVVGGYIESEIAPT